MSRSFFPSAEKGGVSVTELINGFIDFIVELFMFVWPEISIEADILANMDSYIHLAIDLLKKINFLIPVPLIFFLLSTMITLKVASVVLWAVNWIIKRIFDVIP